MISEKISEIRSHIRAVCDEIGADSKEIVLVGVTKYTTIDHAGEAIAAGVTDLGENRVQDAKQKFGALQNQGLTFKRHMIGHLQTNKVKDAVELFDMIQSVDSVKVAKEIDKQASNLNKEMDVLVQVNSSREEQKSGVDPEGLLDLIEEISAFERLNIQGLMTIGLFTDDQKKITACFELVKMLFEQAKRKFADHPRVDMKYLSMGMTQDYQIALRCGANMIRIGSAIFT